MGRRAHLAAVLAVAATVALGLWAGGCAEGKKTAKKKSPTPSASPTETATPSPTATVATSAATPTSAPSAGGASESAFGYVKSVGGGGASYTLTIDYAELLTGKAAVDAAHKDGAIPPDQDYVENDYYISNKNPKLRTFPISPSAQIRLLESVGSTDTKAVTTAQFKAEVRPDAPVKIVVDNGSVTKIDEQFFP